jgi:hypothetical protein
VPITDEERQAIAKQEARRYMRLSWVDQREVEQEALYAMLEAEETWERTSQVGNLGAYLRNAASYAVRWFVWTQTAPVHITDRANSGKQAGENRKAPLTKKKRDASTPDEEGAERPELALPPTEDDDVHDVRWRQRVQMRLVELLCDEPYIDQIIAWRVLVHEETPEHVTRAENIPSVKNTYEVVSRIRGRIRRDAEMRRLLDEQRQEGTRR